MRALTTALVLALSSSALAQEPAVPGDAPVLLDAGQPAPSAGLFLPEPAAILAAQRLASAEAKVRVYESQSPGLPWWAVAVVAGLALGAGVGVGYSVARR